MPQKPIAIVAALETELAPLVKRWSTHLINTGGRMVRVYESDDAAAVAGGIGAEAAAAASQLILEIYKPNILISCGLAGATTALHKVGEAFRAGEVIDSTTGKRWSGEGGKGILVSSPKVANAGEKKQLAELFSADAVDMEAASVAGVAEGNGIRFMAVKAISDAPEFAMPAIERFIDTEGRFSQRRFVQFLLLRPTLWPATVRLAQNTRRATKALACLMSDLIGSQQLTKAR